MCVSGILSASADSCRLARGSIHTTIEGPHDVEAEKISTAFQVVQGNVF